MRNLINERVIKLEIIKEYKNIIEQIATLNSRIETAERELKKNIDIYKPSNLKAISYDNTRVKISHNQQSIIKTANNIYELNEKITSMKTERKSLKIQLRKLENVIYSLGDTKKKIIMLQIKGYTQSQIAEKLNYSLRWIEKLCSKIKKEDGVSSV